VSLPDLTRADAPVRLQISERYAFLTGKLRNPATPAADLGAAYGEMGKLLMAAEYRDSAEGCFINAQALAPAEPRWPYYLGHLYKARGEAAKSRAAFEGALRLQPRDLTTLVRLGDAYLDEGRPDEAEPLFTRALAEQPRSAAALYGLGRAALARSDYRRAVGYLEQALSLDPQDAVMHYPLALAYRGLGDMARTEAHMRQRAPGDVRLPDPWMLDLEAALQSAVAYEVRGAKALDERDWKAAAAYFRKGIELAPEEPSLHHKLGTALFLNGDARGAAEQFEEALRLSPRFAKAHYSLGVLLGSSGRTAPALAQLTAAVRDDPAYVEARLRLADVLRRSGRSREALLQYEQAAKLDPRIPEAPFGYAMVLVDLGRYREARDRLVEGMKLYPDEPAFARAAVRLLAAAPDDRARDGQAALGLIQRLLAREPRSSDTDEMMAMTMAENRQFDDAVTWQRAAIAEAQAAGRQELAPKMVETLSRYERRQPCRIPWRDEAVLAGPLLAR
jgi:tetratricopeptide (TPR) repeat protein